MKGFDVLKVKSAVKSRNKFDLSCSHLTTMDFGEIVPLYSLETVPGDEIKVNAEYFSRMAPLVEPTYGKFQFKTLAGFVPYHQIAVDAEAWLAGKSTWQGQTPKHRYFTVKTWHDFVVYCSTTTGATSSNCDYSYKDASGATVLTVFTAAGKKAIKIMNALGYALPQGVDLRTTSAWYTTVMSTKLSAYPLLAFIKLYNDYMSQSQRYNTSVLSDTLYKIKNGISFTSVYNAGTGELLAGALPGLLNEVRLNYENDYFTSAWQLPNNAINSVEITNDRPNTNSYSLVGTSTVDNYTDLTVSNNSTRLGQRALDFLKSFDDWVRRNNYSGSREVQQLYSRFGIKMDDFRSHYAHIVSTDSMPIQVGDVTSTADTTGAYLGDYAGKGIMSGSNGVSYKTSDFGMFFILGYFTVTPMNPYGSDRVVLRNSPFDYYNPEFDGLGADPISVGEYFASPIQVSENPSDTTKDTDVFGYTERYNSYRYGRDKITGEFRNYHSNPINAWHTGRLLADVRGAGNLVAQSSSVNTLEQTNSQYNRIFSVTSNIVDHFYLTCRFNVSAIRPMLNLNQVVNLGVGDTVVPRNGNVVS